LLRRICLVNRTIPTGARRTKRRATRASQDPTERTITGSGSHLRVQAAGGWPTLVDRAASRVRIQKTTITIGTSGQREDAVPEVEVVDQARFFQPPGNLLGRIVFGLKRVDQAQLDQVRQTDLDRHGAAVGRAGVTQAVAVTAPGVATVNIHDGDG